jgi:hypothetical protein
MRPTFIIRKTSSVFAALVLLAGVAAADSVEDFYKASTLL